MYARSLIRALTLASRLDVMMASQGRGTNNRFLVFVHAAVTICAIRGKLSDMPDGKVFHLSRVTGVDLSESSLRHAAHSWKGQQVDPASLGAGSGRGAGNQPQSSPFIR